MANRNWAMGPKRGRNGILINSRHLTRGYGFVGDRRKAVIGAECPECKKSYSRSGGSCGDCADERQRFVLIVDILAD